MHDAATRSCELVAAEQEEQVEGCLRVLVVEGRQLPAAACDRRDTRECAEPPAPCTQANHRAMGWTGQCNDPLPSSTSVTVCRLCWSSPS